MYKDLLDFLREKVDILEVHEVIDKIESADDLPQVNSHLATQLEMLLAEFVEDNYPNAFLGQQFLSSLDMKEILEDL